MPVPARLHVIPASHCAKAMILRRGPSEQVVSILWDRATDTFETGQWLKGRIYEHRSDLSQDGRHFVYFAGKRGTYWTAVSRAPHLRAVFFEAQSGTWGGGGAFDSIGRLWLGGQQIAPSKLPDGLKCAPDNAFPASTDGFHLGDTYVTTLSRRGWAHKSGTGYDSVLHRDAGAGWTLELRFELMAENRAIVSNRYALVHAETANRIDLPAWEWAEPWDEFLVFASDGILQRIPLTQDMNWENSSVIKDFNNMDFEALEAPYQGVAGQ